MDGVERPRYFNERDRRFKAGEEERLLTALRKLDWEHSVQAHVEALLDAEYESTEFSSLSAQKKVFAARRKELRVIAERDVVVTPQLETSAQFLLMTAARRGEALKLTNAHAARQVDRPDLSRPPR